jgi:uncharacterized protein (DUF2252 family)
MQSPFAFYRGTALNMAADLGATPTTGVYVQACGDCHLTNFGAFATPERRVIVDINDLDETLPAPWEWDVKRLATSFVLACRNNGHARHAARDAAQTCVRAYREHMNVLAEMRVLDVWYSGIDLERLIPKVRDETSRTRIRRRLKKARRRDVLLDDFPRLVASDGTRLSIREAPPLVFRPRGRSAEESASIVARAFRSYLRTLPEHRRRLVERFRLVDIAVKVVGVGSVGTHCYIVLMMAEDNDPLFLQVKEARPSVLAPYAGKSRYRNDGQRIVVGHHLMQSASDVFLGWTSNERGRHYYVRQLRDVKIKPLVELFSSTVMLEYAELCGQILARAHARSSEPALISGYLGRSERFDEAVADFAVAYADQAERDYEQLARAVRSGSVEVVLDA